MLAPLQYIFTSDNYNNYYTGYKMVICIDNDNKTSKKELYCTLNIDQKIPLIAKLANIHGSQKTSNIHNQSNQPKKWLVSVPYTAFSSY